MDFRTVHSELKAVDTGQPLKVKNVLSAAIATCINVPDLPGKAINALFVGCPDTLIRSPTASTWLADVSNWVEPHYNPLQQALKERTCVAILSQMPFYPRHQHPHIFGSQSGYICHTQSPLYPQLVESTPWRRSGAQPVESKKSVETTTRMG